MPKKAVSVTLDADNIRWLQGQAGAVKPRGLSATLDRLVTEARLAGQVHGAAIRSVVGTIDIGSDDPSLAHADEYIREVFDRSAARPWMAKDAPPDRSGRSRTRKAGRRG
jgi:hypothetical protein